MQKIFDKIIAFRDCEQGSAMPEYALIAGLTCSAIVAALEGFKIDMVATFANIGKKMVEATKFSP